MALPGGCSRWRGRCREAEGSFVHPLFLCRPSGPPDTPAIESGPAAARISLSVGAALAGGVAMSVVHIGVYCWVAGVLQTYATAVPE